MNIDVEVLGEMYGILKPYIPAKDRQEAADNLIGSMVDMLGDHELKTFAATDTSLLKALKEYSYDEDEDHDEEYDE